MSQNFDSCPYNLSCCTNHTEYICGFGVSDVIGLTVCRILRGIGYQRQRVYQGSFVDWVENGGEVIEADFEVDYDLK